MGKYDRQEIIAKLRKKGLRAVYFSGTRQLSHFTIPPRIHLGNKCLGYLDFLGVKAMPMKLKNHNKKRTSEKMNPVFKIKENIDGVWTALKDEKTNEPIVFDDVIIAQDYADSTCKYPYKIIEYTEAGR